METTEVRTKKRLSTPKKIIVGILLALVLLIVGAMAFVLIKMYGMSIGATKFVAKPTVSPFNTPDPGLSYWGDLDLTKDVDSSLDPNLIYDDPIYLENPIDPDVVNILVLGEDAGDGGASSGRSDVMLIVSYNQRLNTVRVVQLSRKRRSCEISTSEPVNVPLR